MKRELFYTILPNDANHTVEWVLRHRLNLSTKAIRRAKFLDDGIVLGGKRVFTTHPVEVGQSLSFNLQNEEDTSENIVPVKGPVNLVYEDLDIAIVNKGRNTPVHPSLGHYDDSLANFMTYYYLEQGQQFVFRAVNRLDSNTSGLMIVAKNSHAHKQLSQQIMQKSLKRVYQALVMGAPQPPQGVICAPIKRKAERELLRIVADDGLPAVTHYETLEQYGNYTLVELRLETGRTHQIRVHMAHIGCPVVGDFLYGTEDVPLIDGHALHAKSLTFVHPITGEPMHFDSDLPEDMVRILQKTQEKDR